MIELMSTLKHVLAKGDVLCLCSDTFLYDPFHTYKIDEPPESVVFTSEIVNTNNNRVSSRNSGGGRHTTEYRLTFPKAGRYIIKVTKLAADPKNNVKHEIEVVVQ
jgi:hypothetical protein